MEAVLLEELPVLFVETLDHVGADCLIQHCGRAHLNRSASKREVARGLRHIRYPADAGEALVGECLRELRHLRECHRKNGRAAKSSARDESIDIDLELQCLGIDEWKRRESIG